MHDEAIIVKALKSFIRNNKHNVGKTFLYRGKKIDGLCSYVYDYTEALKARNKRIKNQPGNVSYTFSEYVRPYLDRYYISRPFKVSQKRLKAAKSIITVIEGSVMNLG